MQLQYQISNTESPPEVILADRQLPTLMQSTFAPEREFGGMPREIFLESPDIL